MPGGGVVADANWSRTIAVNTNDPRDLRETKGFRINDSIRANEVRVVAPNGEQVGVKPLHEALTIARELDLDLVEVAPMAQPPVCKILDFGKWRYEESQRQKESRRHQTQIIIKEMKFRPKIDPHDYETKKRHIERFLTEGAKVKVTIMFRGREMAHTDLGARILTHLAEDLGELGLVESPPKLDGRNMIMVIAPLKKEKK